MSAPSRVRVLVAALTISASGFAAWQANEGWSDVPIIPTQGDVPTIGHGSTKYEDGAAVKLTDPPITRERGEVLARNLLKRDEKQLAASIPGVKLYPEEFDVYMDFVGQYGIGNWRGSVMRRDLVAGNYRQACNGLLKYRFAAGYDCSTTVHGRPNKRCWGVWTRQLDRNQKCLAAQ